MPGIIKSQVDCSTEVKSLRILATLMFLTPVPALLCAGVTFWLRFEVRSPCVLGEFKTEQVSTGNLNIYTPSIVACHADEPVRSVCVTSSIRSPGRERNSARHRVQTGSGVH